MLRLLALCAFVAVAHAVDKSEGLENATRYKVKTKTIRRAVDVVQQYVVEREYDVFEPELHYLVLVGVAHVAALNFASDCVNLDPQQSLLDALTYVLPQVLLNPNETVVEVLDTQNVTVAKVQPLLDLVEEVCDDLGRKECDRVISPLVAKNPELQQAEFYLDAAYYVANGLLAKQRRLVEVAKSLNVVPYVVDNVVDASNYVLLLSRLLRLVGHVPVC